MYAAQQFGRKQAGTTNCFEHHVTCKKRTYLGNKRVPHIIIDIKTYAKQTAKAHANVLIKALKLHNLVNSNAKLKHELLIQLML